MKDYKTIIDEFRAEHPSSGALAEYAKIIRYRQENPLSKEEHGEVHHILPKKVYPIFKREKWNLVKLTFQEHYRCHFLLKDWFKESGNEGYEKMVYACWRMTNTKKGEAVRNEEEYAKLREEVVEAVSEAHKGKKSSFCGKHHSEESRKRMSEVHKGKYPTEESRKRMSAAHKGEKNYLYHPFFIDGVRYETTLEAAAALGVIKQTISNWLRGETKKTSHICQYC